MKTRRLLVGLGGAGVFAGLGFGMGMLFGGELMGRSATAPQASSGADASAELAELRRRLRDAEGTIALLEEGLELAQRPQPAPRPAAKVPTLPAAADGAEKEDAGAQARIAELEALLALAREGKAPLSDEELANKVDETRRAFEDAIAAKDGAAAMSLMKELAGLDERAFPELVAMWKTMNEKEWLGLNWRDRSGWADADLLHWALTPEGPALGDPELVKEFRATALMMLNFVEGDLSAKSETYSRLIESLPRPEELDPEQQQERSRRGGWGPDADLYRGALRSLARIPSAEASAALTQVANDPSLPLDVRRTAVDGLTRQQTPESLAALRRAVNDADPQIRRVAEVGIIRRDPPVNGWLITDVTKDSQAARAGIGEGAIIVSYNGQPVRSTRDLVRLRQEAAGEVTMTVYRNGATQTIRLQGNERIGVNGEGVEVRGN